MGFLQPLLLWGALAISIPILIHLWHRRRGKKIQWAAMRWLIDKEDQPKKGFKPDHLLLLLLRMLIIFLVVLFLSEPLIGNIGKDSSTESIHLVEPNPALVSEFRFELEQAISDGKEMYWLNESLNPIASLEEVTDLVPGNGIALREAIDTFVKSHHDLHLYLSPHTTYMEPPFYLSPVPALIHLGAYTRTPASDKYLELGTSRFLFINQQGVLEKSQTPPDGKMAADHSGPFFYYIDLEDPEETNNITSALEAIREVYGLDFQESGEQTEINLYFSSDVPPTIPEEQLLIVSNYQGDFHPENIPVSREPFLKEKSGIVASGRLPEYILDKILKHHQLTQNIQMVSRQQLESQFVVETIKSPDKKGNIQEWIILLLLITLIIERVLALRKGM